MASIIDYKYFLGERLIGGIESKNIQDVVAQYISRYELELYEKLMGYELANLFFTGIQQNTVEQRYIDILQGVTFENRNRQIRWDGLRQEACKMSIVADYVYYKYLRDNYTKSARVGVVKPQTENATMFNPNAKMVNAWNRISEQYKILRLLLSYQTTDGSRTYPEYHDRYHFCHEFSPINAFGI